MTSAGLDNLLSGHKTQFHKFAAQPTQGKVYVFTGTAGSAAAAKKAAAPVLASVQVNTAATGAAGASQVFRPILPAPLAQPQQAGVASGSAAAAASPSLTPPPATAPQPQTAASFTTPSPPPIQSPAPVAEPVLFNRERVLAPLDASITAITQARVARVQSEIVSQGQTNGALKTLLERSFGPQGGGWKFRVDPELEPDVYSRVNPAIKTILINPIAPKPFDILCAQIVVYTGFGMPQLKKE